MAFCSNPSQQISMDDAMLRLSKREQKYLENSWAQDFSENVFTLINEKRFEVLYSKNPATRPNNPVNVYLGLLILKEIFNQSDEEAVESLMFDLRYQYALHTTSFQEQPVSKNSLSNFRTAICRYDKENNTDLLKEEFEQHAEKFRKLLKIDGRTIRMDSLMISSSCKKLSRLELLYTCLKDVIVEVEKEGKLELPQNLKEYLRSEHHNERIYRCKDTEVSARLTEIISDALEMQKIVSNTFLESSDKANLLSRVIEEQSEDTPEGIRPKDSKEISPESLQSPKDPDATYRTKAGKKHVGYVGNVVETFDKNGSIVTKYDLQKNIYSDQHFSKDFIEAMGRQEEPVTVMVDGAYYGDEIAKEAEKNNIEIVPGNLTGREPNGDYSLFELDMENQKILKCIMGYAPVDCKKNGETYRAHFAKECCSNCSLREKCPVKEQRKNYLLQMKEVHYNSALIRNKLGTAEYRNKTRQRAGVEGLPSILRRKYHVDNMPVRGLICAQILFGLKIEAINVKKCFKKSIAKRKRNLAISINNLFLYRYQFF